MGTRSKTSLPTVSGLRQYYSSIIAAKNAECNDWAKTRSWAIEENIFDAARIKTTIRYVSHLIKMIGTLSDEQLSILVDGDDSEQIAMLWLGFCKAFPIVGMFAHQVIHEKYVTKDFHLGTEDLWEFFRVKSDEMPELNDIGRNTRSKLQSVVFCNLREAGYISKANELRTAALSRRTLAHMTFEEQCFFPYQEAI